MPRENRPLGPQRFWRHEGWNDGQAGFLLWPALWLRRHVSRGLFLQEHTLTLGWGTWRWRLTRVDDTTPSLAVPTSWQAIAGPGFLTWAQATFGGSWPKERAQDFFRQQPKWRDLVTLGHLDNHYLRILIAREMLSQVPPEG